MRIRSNRGARRDRREEKIQFVLCVLCGLCGCFLSLSAQQQPPAKPSFQSSVEVTSLDVTVVDDKGKPVAGLTPADFLVRIDGNPRRVVSAEWVPLIAEGSTPVRSAASSSPGPNVSHPIPSSVRIRRSASERFALIDGRTRTSPSGHRDPNASRIREALRRNWFSLTT